MITFSHFLLSNENGTIDFNAPTYLFTEDLLEYDDGSGTLFKWVVNSDSSYLEIGHGKLVQVGDGANLTGTPFNPSNAQYDGTGWIDLGNRPSGDGTKLIDTGWIAPQNSQWTIYGIYDVVDGSSYKMYAISYNGNETCDIYLYEYSEGTNFPITPTYSNVEYIPPTDEWKIYEYAPLVTKPSEIEYNMSTFYIV